MAVEHEPPFDRVHRAVDALDGMRDAIVEQGQPVEARLDQIVQNVAGGGLVEQCAEQVAVVHQDRFTADRPPFVAR